MSRSASAKKILLWSHRWFGLIAGFHFVLMGLSGSFLVYEDDIKDLINRRGRISQESIETPSLAAIVAAAQTSVGTDNPPVRMQIPARADGNLILNFDVAKAGEKRAPLLVFVDPSTFEVRDQELSKETVSGMMSTFHHELFWGDWGKSILAVSAIFMVLMVLAGLYLWWPRRTRWKDGFKFRKMTNAFLANFEIHRVLGIYTVILLLLVTITGALISRPAWFLTMPKNDSKGMRADGSKIERQKFDFVAIEKTLKDQGFAFRGLRFRIEPKKNMVEVTDLEGRRVSLYASGEPSEKPLRQFNPIRQTSFQLHSGDYWGALGRMLVFLTGLLPLVFYVSGFYIWWQKSAAKKSRRA